jgi:cell division septum initiation protein DivIVA
MGDEDNKKAAELVELLERRSLPASVRGYDREATDRLLAQLDEGLKAVLQQQAAALSRASDLERRLSEGHEREEAVTEALVVATQIRADSEREAKELKERYAQEGEGIKQEAQRRADEILRDAESQAQSIVGEAKANAHAFDQRIRDAQELAERIRAHLTSFLRSMLEEVDRRNEESASIVGDLLGRTAETTRTEWDVAGIRSDGGRDERGGVVDWERASEAPVSD